MVGDYVSRLFGAYLERRNINESFTHFCARTSDADLISIATQAAPMSPPSELGIARWTPSWSQHSNLTNSS
jgi:hypothetical protein